MFVNKLKVSTCFYVRINVDELHEFLKAGDAALQTFQDDFEDDHHYFPSGSATFFLNITRFTSSLAIALTDQTSYFLTMCSTYIRISLTSWMRAMMKEPKAAVPR